MLSAWEDLANDLQAQVDRLRGERDVWRSKVEFLGKSACDLRRQRDKDLDDYSKVQERNRDAARILIDAVGSDGPEALDDTARRAADEIMACRNEQSDLQHDFEQAQARIEELESSPCPVCAILESTMHIHKSHVDRLRDERNQWRAAALMQVDADDLDARRAAIVERFGLDALKDDKEGGE